MGADTRFPVDLPLVDAGGDTADAGGDAEPADARVDALSPDIDTGVDLGIVDLWLVDGAFDATTDGVGDGKTDSVVDGKTDSVGDGKTDSVGDGKTDSVADGVVDGDIDDAGLDSSRPDTAIRDGTMDANPDSPDSPDGAAFDVSSGG